MSKPNKQAKQARGNKGKDNKKIKEKKFNDINDNINISELVKPFLKKGIPEQDILRILSEITTSLVKEAIRKASKELIKEESRKISEIIKITEEGILIPSIFTKELSVLEAIIKFLRENKNLRYSEIAKLINRDPRSVWLTYKRAIKKRKEPLIIDESLRIPISIFSNKEFLGLSPLQVITFYLHDHQKLSFSRISSILKKNYTTIYTSYSRAVEKLNQTKQGKKQKEENGR